MFTCAWCPNLERRLKPGDDNALSLAALGIRIAPMPGKGTIGIEVPNRHPIVAYAFYYYYRKIPENEMDLPIALGKTISNEVYSRFVKIPHMLVTGATGPKRICRY